MGQWDQLLLLAGKPFETGMGGASSEPPSVAGGWSSCSPRLVALRLHRLGGEGSPVVWGGLTIDAGPYPKAGVWRHVGQAVLEGSFGGKLLGGLWSTPGVGEEGRDGDGSGRGQAQCPQGEVVLLQHAPCAEMLQSPGEARTSCQLGPGGPRAGGLVSQGRGTEEEEEEEAEEAVTSLYASV